MLNNLLPTSRPELFQVRRQWYYSVETTGKQGTKGYSCYHPNRT
jgi:hypothetical protein